MQSANAEVISIHALLAESDPASSTGATKNDQISIHALLAESDQTHSWHFAGVSEFLSTLSLRRATRGGGFSIILFPISIHALLAESDSRIPT